MKLFLSEVNFVLGEWREGDRRGTKKIVCKYTILCSIFGIIAFVRFYATRYFACSRTYVHTQSLFAPSPVTMAAPMFWKTVDLHRESTPRFTELLQIGKSVSQSISISGTMEASRVVVILGYSRVYRKINYYSSWVQWFLVARTDRMFSRTLQEWIIWGIECVKEVQL